ERVALDAGQQDLLGARLQRVADRVVLDTHDPVVTRRRVHDVQPVVAGERRRDLQAGEAALAVGALDVRHRADGLLGAGLRVQVHDGVHVALVVQQRAVGQGDQTPDDVVVGPDLLRGADLLDRRARGLARRADVALVLVEVRRGDLEVVRRARGQSVEPRAGRRVSAAADGGTGRAHHV